MHFNVKVLDTNVAFEDWRSANVGCQQKKLISFPSPRYVDKKKIRLILAQCMLVQCPAWSQVQQVRIHPPATTSRNASSTSGPPVSWKDKVEPVSSVSSSPPAATSEEQRL